MDFSIFYAKLIGFYYIIVALCMFINPKTMQAFIVDVLQEKDQIIWTGLMSILFGLILVLTHNIWTGWPIIITLLGYIGIIRGIIRLCCTDWFSHFAPNLAKAKFYFSTSVVLLILGIVLLCLGYSA